MFELKMEVMMLRKGRKKDCKDRSEIDLTGSGIEFTKDSENVGASTSFLPQLQSVRQAAK